MPSKKNISTENLRRSSRAEVLRQKAEAEKAIAAQKSEKLARVSTKPLERKRLKSKTGIGKNNKSSTLARIPQDDDDGFIPDDTPVDPASPPAAFDELELWKQYQKFGGDASDDGFIPDDDAASETGDKSAENPHEAAASSATTKKMLKDALRRVHKGKTHSKKKRRKREMKWLKKLFHESVVIAQPLDTDKERAAGDASTASEDQESITLPVPVDRGIPQRPNEDSADPTGSNGPSYPPGISYGGPSTDIPYGSSTFHSVEGATDVAPFMVHGASVEGKRPTGLDNNWDRLQQASGLTKFEFTQHLLKLYTEDRESRPCAEPSEEPGNRPDVSTRFIDLTSGKSESEDRKKRYKMELSLPEGTTILVTNLVQRETSLPKVIFMLKKTSPGGAAQGAPLLMECSGEASSRQQGHSENHQKALQQEIQEISRQFLQLPKKHVEAVSKQPTPVSNQPTPVPKAISCSMGPPKNR